MEKNYDMLKLENQLCFPLYACSREIVKKYRPFLDELELTYTQYIVMMVMWDKKRVSVKELGEKLYLDSGTLTPARSAEDERVLITEITDAGEKLKEAAADIPQKIACCVKLTQEEAGELYRILYKILGDM